MSHPVDDERWLSFLPENHYGRKVLTQAAASAIARDWPSRWYIAPYSTRWAVGKATAGAVPQSFHVVDDDGEPLCFDTIADAQTYLKDTLGVTARELRHSSGSIPIDAIQGLAETEALCL